MLKQWSFPVLAALLAGSLLSGRFIDGEPAKPDDNRFTPVVLTPEGALDEPMVFQVMKNGTVYIIEHKGAFKKFNPATKTVDLIATIPVFKENEQGLVGFTMDPGYDKNHWIYLYYAHPTESNMRLTRWELRNDKLLPASEKILLEIPVDRAETSHTGGGMTWDAAGNLYLTVGNNTGNSYMAQTDERLGRSRWDDQRGAGNTNDLRGKILRIHPEPDGTYSIPAGNLFPKGGDPKARPEIYIMGTRNAWRPSIDSKTGWLYWGEIGPDADVDSENGPRGYDELNQARKPGFFGWPYFIGNNFAYPVYDYAANKPTHKLDPLHPVNKSVNNTGLTALPPAQPAFIYYPYAVSERFPLVGSSSRCAIGGPVYHQSDVTNPKRPFPAYYEGKWLAADLSRFWIMAISMKPNGDYDHMERFAPDYHPRQPIDLKFGPEGDLYVLEYGGSTLKSPSEARLVRIEYNAGNRKPVVQASASKRGGALPLSVTLLSDGTKDYDGDRLTYRWHVSGKGQPTRSFTMPNPPVVFDKAGIYTATLTVTDAKGAQNSQTLRIVAGNEPPAVSLTLAGNSQFFFPDKPVQYAVAVTDREDGSLSSGKISPDRVAVSMDYVSEGFDFADAHINQQKVDASTQFAVARAMISKTDCGNCHNVAGKGVGPSYRQIAGKYKTAPSATDRLARKVIAGGTGVWGTEAIMPAHPTLALADARTIVNYMLNIDTQKLSTLPVQGTYTTRVPADDPGRGKYMLRAAYTDRPTTVPSQTTEAVVVLRTPQLLPTDAEVIQGAVRDQLDDYTFMTAKPNTYIGFRQLDLTDVRQIEFRPNWHLYDIYRGGFIDIRLDSPTGPIIGTTELKEEQFNIKKFPGGIGNFWGGPPGSDRNLKTTASRATLTNVVRGRHDVYFMFRNSKGPATDALFPLASITLHD